MSLTVCSLCKQFISTKSNVSQSNSSADFNVLQELSYIDQAVLLSPLQRENPLSVLGDQYDLKHRDDGILPDLKTRTILPDLKTRRHLCP